ncbi:MAG: 3-deoxy-D-manno-octulosonic acid transferase [Deltaproteobacteria bacterium]|nr:3-deoxy-D-manno-octulosonic acid transferase [Deltaproteobacteria bacterium]MBW2129701.1 3-deoxy-D-manno-octulosonic acid transferase [Deltaproteobacteria bacterium]
MKPLYGLYGLSASGLLTVTFPGLWLYAKLKGRHGEGLKERLGLFPPGPMARIKGSPRIWMHAASLGEVKVASAIQRALFDALPDCALIISTTTEHGRNLARETFPRSTVIYAPIDVPFCVREGLSRVRPDIMVFLETEIWPAWITETHRRAVKIALVNGRISPRSLNSYLKLRPFFREVLKKIDAFSMIRQEDADRILSMGAPRERLRINGNAKYDLLTEQAEAGSEEKMRRTLGLRPSDQILVAGSTRDGEEDMILDAYMKIRENFPELLLFLAPRHIQRAPEIEALVRKRGLEYRLRSEMPGDGPNPNAPVVIMDTFGELFRLYSIATITFCGASLVPLGGQNPLEPAAWGKAPLYGPSMEDFLDAKEMLEAVGGGIEVSSAQDLTEKALWFLNNPEELKARGERAREAVMKNRRAAKRHAEVILELLS